MVTYAIQRVLLGAVTLFIVCVVTFLAINAMPGNVVEARLQESPTIDPKRVEEIKAELGLDKPLVVRFQMWFTDIVRGDLGYSYWSGEPVNDAVKRTAPISIEIAVMAIVIGAFLATVFGVIAALNHNGIIDHLVRITGLLALAVPGFWMATLFMTYALKWFGYSLPISYKSIWDDPAANLQLTFAAAAVIGLGASGGLVRIVRSSLLEVLRQDYMRTAAAKGLNARRMIYGHALRNAAIPLFTLLGLQFAGLLSGTVIIETVFSIPGLGQLMVGAIRNRDLVLVQSLVLVFAVMLVGVNIVVDISYGLIDPRIRVGA